MLRPATVLQQEGQKVSWVEAFRGWNRWHLVHASLDDCEVPADAGEGSSGVEAGDSRSPTCIFAGRLCGPEIDPSFFMPLRTPDRKSFFSG